MSKEIATTRALDPIAEARRQWVAHGWEDAAPGMAAVTTITRAQQILEARVEDALTPYGLTFARFEILRLLGFTRSGQLPMGKISDRLQIHPASVTSAVKRLEREGLIDRRSDELDSRVVLASLLPAGRRVLEPATAAVNRVFESTGLDDAQIEQLIDLLDPIRAIAGDRIENRSGDESV
ncbi:MAG TPA: MarR family transcriptional regulator [Acidimicrobiia bacterium]|nr:MarR family transcriptional regulator [Acidimicrobiia bacterium]